MCPKEDAEQPATPLKHGVAAKVAARPEACSSTKLNLNLAATLLPYPASNVFHRS